MIKILLTLLCIGLIYWYIMNNQLERFTNNRGCDYFYFNDKNIHEKLVDEKKVWQSQIPYLAYSPCNYGYKHFPSVTIDTV